MGHSSTRNRRFVVSQARKATYASSNNGETINAAGEEVNNSLILFHSNEHRTIAAHNDRLNVTGTNFSPSKHANNGTLNLRGPSLGKD